MERQLPNVSDALSHFEDHSPCNSIRKLLSLPHVLLPVLNLSNITPQDPTQLYNLVRYDASLVVRMLETHRKSFQTDKPKPEAFSSIKDRILSTSTGTVKSLVLSTFHDRNGIYTCGSALAQEYLKKQWLNSLQCAFLAKSFALQVGYQDTEEAYFAGLLHNIGQLILHAEDGDEYLNACAYRLPGHVEPGPAKNDKALLASEKSRFAFDHCELGVEVCKMWNLSIPLQDAVRFHHASFEQVADAHILTRIINLSRAITEGEFTAFGQCTNTVASLLQIPRDHIAPIIESAIAQASDVIRSLGVPLSDHLIDQKLVPIHDNDSDHIPLQDAIKLNQLTREIHFCGILETFKGELLNVSSEKAIQQQTQLSAATLFDIEKVYFFKFNPTNNYIVGDHQLEEHSIVNELSIQAEQGRSILANAVVSGGSQDTFNLDYESLSIVDKEILNQASASQLLCQPLFNDKKIVGVLVFTLNDDGMLQLPATRKHIEDFSNAVSSAITKVQRNNEQFNSLLHAERSLYQTKLKRMTHEINNPLSIAQNHLHILSVSEHSNPQHYESIQIIQEEINRASNLLKEHVDGSQTNPAQLRAININEVLSDLLLVFEDGLSNEHCIGTERQLDKNLPPIFLDDGKLKQILTNLLKNAFESIENDGWLCVRTYDKVIFNGSQYIEIQVSNDGPGIPKSIEDRLFSPIETFKGEDHSGIGLSIVKELTNQLKGLVSYRKEFDGTTTFSLFFLRKTEI